MIGSHIHLRGPPLRRVQKPNAAFILGDMTRTVGTPSIDYDHVIVAGLDEDMAQRQRQRLFLIERGNNHRDHRESETPGRRTEGGPLRSRNCRSTVRLMRYGRLMQRLRVLTLTPVLLLVVTVMSERG